MSFIFRCINYKYLREFLVFLSLAAIKQLIVSIGSSSSPTTFYKYCQDITNIQMDEKQLQAFSLRPLLLSDYFLSSQKFDLIKIEIIENHGDPDWNFFYEFQLF